MVTGATVTALFAYFLWNIDVHCCGTLTRWKRQLGMPLGILLELHGYWHILTSISAYMFMAIIEFLISDEDANRRRGFAWCVTFPTLIVRLPFFSYDSLRAVLSQSFLEAVLT